MKTIKPFTLILAFIVTLLTFSACSNENMTGISSERNDADTISNDSGLIAKKVGNIKISDLKFGNGIYYIDDNKKYGVLSLDGKIDTGAKYFNCETIGNYLQVTAGIPNDWSDIDAINSVGIINHDGEIVIPTEYAMFKILNDRYIQVVKATERSYSKDDYLFRYTAELISTWGEEDDAILFNGTWAVYDIVAGKEVKGIFGTKATSVSACGNYVKYIADDGEERIVNANGASLPKEATLFSNGSYVTESETTGILYDTNDNVLFEYSLDDYKPTSGNDEYYICAKYYPEEHKNKYVIRDKSGEIVSAEFNEPIHIYNDYVLIENRFCDFKGETVFDINLLSSSDILFDEVFQRGYIFKNNDEKVIVDDNCNVLYRKTQKENTTIDNTNFSISKEIEFNKFSYYSYKNKDFIYDEGYSCGPWLVAKKSSEGLYSIVDTLTGDVLIRDYKYYYHIVVNNSVYIYAQIPDGGFDVYIIK